MRDNPACLTAEDCQRMEMRVMSVGCTDQDFRRLMDSHMRLLGFVGYAEATAWAGEASPNARDFTRIRQAANDLMATTTEATDD